MMRVQAVCPSPVLIYRDAISMDDPGASWRSWFPITQPAAPPSSACFYVNDINRQLPSPSQTILGARPPMHTPWGDGCPPVGLARAPVNSDCGLLFGVHYGMEIICQQGVDPMRDNALADV